ncbi:MAG: GNAT family N-acetyltransferase [Clostridia bacterium]|nr:GNAT family N-acetyltransferase [Clostridia bacterium]
MEIRRAAPADSRALAELAAQLFSSSAEELEPEFTELTADAEAACFLATDGEEAIGFAQCQLRHDYVEGCKTSPVGFLEGIYVAEGHRLTGTGRALLSACEAWAREMDCSEFASDCELDNVISHTWHLKNGFREMGRTIWFAKKL